MTDSSAPALDRERFEELVQRAAPTLLAHARRLTRDAALADDLVQETFLRAWRARDGFRGEAAPSTWLHQILHRIALDHFRRVGRERPTEYVEALWRDDAYTVDSANVIERAADRMALQDALVHLPYTYRAAVLLHDVEGWTAAEVAETLDIGLPLAKQRIRRGRMALVSELARADERRAALDGVVLRCWDARALVGEYLDGELAADQAGALEAHLGHCPTCPPLYASLVGVCDALGALHDGDNVIPEGIIDKIRRRAGG